MPPRTSRTSRASAPRGSIQSPPRNTSTSNATNAIAYHASQITILWVVILALAIGGFFVGVSILTQLQRTESHAIALQQEVMKIEARLQTASAGTDLSMGGGVGIAVAVPVPDLMGEPDMIKPSSPPSRPMAMSPSGALNRGSLSPDGTKYAGYNDAIKARRGIAVEILESGKVRYIELFSPSQSTGTDTEQSAELSVRWKDNSTIEYDVLVTQDGKQVKEVQTTQIFF